MLKAVHSCTLWWHTVHALPMYLVTTCWLYAIKCTLSLLYACCYWTLPLMYSLQAAIRALTLYLVHVVSVVCLWILAHIARAAPDVRRSQHHLHVTNSGLDKAS